MSNMVFDMLTNDMRNMILPVHYFGEQDIRNVLPHSMSLRGVAACTLCELHASTLCGQLWVRPAMCSSGSCQTAARGPPLQSACPLLLPVLWSLLKPPYRSGLGGFPLLPSPQRARPSSTFTTDAGRCSETAVVTSRSAAWCDVCLRCRRAVLGHRTGRHRKTAHPARRSAEELQPEAVGFVFARALLLPFRSHSAPSLDTLLVFLLCGCSAEPCFVDNA